MAFAMLIATTQLLTGKNTYLLYFEIVLIVIYRNNSIIGTYLLQ